ncbi:MAG: 8-amino-7-oxononanoate synthase [Verrucomicrobiota bacterium]|jgi:8-amino-7-oxononanoate synthase
MAHVNISDSEGWHGFRGDLAARMGRVHGEGLGRFLRELEVIEGARVKYQGRELVHFASNDYLGLALEPRLRQAGMEGVRSWGAGSGASRLISGSLGVHHELERALASFKRTESALVFGSGYTAALGVLPALLERGDLVVLDRLAHACLVDGARLSGAKLRVFRHNDTGSLESVLRQHRDAEKSAGREPSRVLVVTESLFSMDGDVAPLREIVEVKERYGAWLMVDEAHATGVLGSDRRGLVDEYGMGDRVEVQMGTLGKALGAGGGYIAGARVLTEWLVNRARSFIFSTAPVPAQAAAALEAVKLVDSEVGEARCSLLWDRVHQVRRVVSAAGWLVPETASPILPLVIGGEEVAVDCFQRLIERGFFVPAIRYPSVHRGQARLRLTVSATHTAEQVERVGDALRRVRLEVGL